MDSKGRCDLTMVADKVRVKTAQRIAQWGVEALGCALLVGWIWWIAGGPGVWR